MRRTSIARALHDVLEWCAVFVLALRVLFRRLGSLLRGRPRVPA